ncbi:unnamed protein product, partial [Laminaria digitata]
APRGCLSRDPRAAEIQLHSSRAAGVGQCLHGHWPDVARLFRIRGDEPMNEVVFGSIALIVLVLVLTTLVVLARNLLMPARAAVLTVNGNTELATSTGEKLLSALNDNGILIPSACAGAGTCGLCRVKITEGGRDPLPIEAAHLTKSELREGHHLACQIVLRGDMEVEVPDDLLDAEMFQCQVVSARTLTPLIREVVLQMPDGVRPDIFAGAFVQVTAPPFALAYGDLDVPEAYAEIWRTLLALTVKSDEEVTRAYSISNRPEDTAAGRLVL